MVCGIGCDICDIARMEKIMAKPSSAHFLQRVFAPAELVLFGLEADQTQVKLQKDAQPVLPDAAQAPAEQDAASSTGAQAFAIPPKTIARLAANYAAKEAFLKAAGTGLGGFALCEIAALRKESGAPYYAFSGAAATYIKENALTAHLSLSHDAGIAMAYCVLEG